MIAQSGPAVTGIPEIHVTEQQQFQRCQRRWFLNYREGWTAQMPSIPLWTGDAGHVALEHYYPERSIDHALTMLDAWVAKDKVRLRQQVGPTWGMFEPAIDEARSLLGSVLENYDKFARAKDDFRVIGGENELTGRIRDARGRRIRHAPPIVGRIDAIAIHDKGGIWLIDHKFYAQRPSVSALELDEQLTAYAWLFREKWGYAPAGVIWNVLIKRAPVSPRLLASGKLSKDKGVYTTLGLYKRAIVEHGLDPADYADHLDWLGGKSYDDFFVREYLYKSPAQLDAYAARLAGRYRAMKAIRTPDDAAPALSSWICQGCPFAQVCQTWEHGGDWGQLLPMYFDRGQTPREGSEE